MIVLPRRPLIWLPGDEPNYTHPIFSGLGAYWPCNEGGGTLIRDVFGVSNGVYSGTTPAWEQSPYGPALKLDGSSNWVNVASGSKAGAITTSNGISLSVWLFWRGSTEAYNSLFAHEGSGTGYTWLLKSAQTVAFYNAGGGSDPVGASVIPFNQWLHLVLTWEAAVVVGQDVLRIYQNGVEIENAHFGNSGNANPNSALLIGKSTFGSGRFINGSIRDMGLWSRVLTPAEVQELYATPNLPLRRARKLYSGVAGGPPVQNITGSAGIVSAEAFGCGGQVNIAGNQGITGCSGGIPSAEAFGTTGAVALAPNLTGTAGIASAEAFGANGSVSTNPGISGQYGIPSAEAFGQGAVLIRTFSVFLGNVEVTDYLLAVQVSSGAPRGQTTGTFLQITQSLSSNTTCKCTLRDLKGTFLDGINYPVVGQEFLFYKNGIRIFGGTIEEVSESDPQASTCRLFDLSCTDFGTILDRRVVGQYYPFQTTSLNLIVSDIVNNFLAGDGISQDISSGDPGTALGPVTFNWITARAALQQLSSMTGWDFWIDPNKVLRFFPHTTGRGSAPFNIADNSGNWLAESMRSRVYRGKYRNREFVLSSSQGIALWCDTFSTAIPGPFRQTPQPPDGVRTGFITLYPMTGGPVVTLNGNHQIVKTLTEIAGHVADGTITYDWYWVDPKGAGVFQNPTATPIKSTDVLVVCYPSPVPPVVMVQDTAQIAAMAAIEGNSGIYDAVDQAKDITDPAALQAYAQGLLTRFGSNGMPREVTYSTYTDGLQVGFLQQINTSHPYVPNAEYLITNIQISDIDKQLLLYKVTAVSGANMPDWSAYFAAVARAGVTLSAPNSRESHTWNIAPTIPGLTNPGVQGGVQRELYIFQAAAGLLLSVTVAWGTAPQNEGWGIQVLVNTNGTLSDPSTPYGVPAVPKGLNGPFTFFFQSPTRVFAGDVIQILLQRNSTATPGADLSITVNASVSL